MNNLVELALLLEDIDKSDLLFDEIQKAYMALLDYCQYHKSYSDYANIEMKSYRDRISKLNETINSQEKKLSEARLLVEKEKRKTEKVLRERNRILSHLETVKKVINDDFGRGNRENTKLRLSFLYENDFGNKDLTQDLDSTDCLFDNLSHTLDLDSDTSLEENMAPRTRNKRQKKRSSEQGMKKRRSERNASKINELNEQGEELVATTTINIPRDGQPTASSTLYNAEQIKENINPYEPSAPPLFPALSDGEIETLSPMMKAASVLTTLNANKINTRTHSWNTKALIKGEECNACGKKVKFSKVAAKCKECKAVAHTVCRENVPLPCVPVASTPLHKGYGTIADFTPSMPPMVPALVIHCIKEIESRGLNEIGIYRVPGSEKEVKSLKERLLKCRGVPNLSTVDDIHTVCSCLKDFLRSLKEPLVTNTRRALLCNAVDLPFSKERKANLCRIVSDLPRPNRDTLAYIILHLKKVAASESCKMPSSNLSKMLGPSLVGFPVDKSDDMIFGAHQSNKILYELIAIDAEFWESFLRVQEVSYLEIQKTPSSKSVNQFFSPGITLRSKKRIYFDTP